MSRCISDRGRLPALISAVAVLSSGSVPLSSSMACTVQCHTLQYLKQLLLDVPKFRVHVATSVQGIAPAVWAVALTDA